MRPVYVHRAWMHLDSLSYQLGGGRWREIARSGSMPDYKHLLILRPHLGVKRTERVEKRTLALEVGLSPEFGTHVPEIAEDVNRRAMWRRAVCQALRWWCPAPRLAGAPLRGELRLSVPQRTPRGACGDGTHWGGVCVVREVARVRGPKKLRHDAEAPRRI